MATCHFCGRRFRNSQGVRAHLKACQDYQEAKSANETITNAPTQIGILPRQGSLKGTPESFHHPYHHGVERTSQVRKATRPVMDGVLRRLSEAAECHRRLLIRKIGDRVVAGWWFSGHTVPSEVRARALSEIEGALSALPVHTLCSHEATEIAERIRDRIFGPIIQAQEATSRREAQRLEAEDHRARDLKKQKLLTHGKDYAYSELKEEYLAPVVRLNHLDTVQKALALGLTGVESLEDVEDLVDEILDQELGQ